MIANNVYNTAVVWSHISINQSIIITEHVLKMADNENAIPMVWYTLCMIYFCSKYSHPWNYTIC